MSLLMTVEHADQFYIDGRWRMCATSASTPVVNPTSEQLVGHIASGGPDDVDLAVAAARRAFPAFSQTSVEQRWAAFSN
jgi:aldehyde dehydrogenase (NAD+)